MELLFAILSILLILIGIRTQKKIHAIAGIVFLVMLIVSIWAEVLEGFGNLAVKGREIMAESSEDSDTSADEEAQIDQSDNESAESVGDIESAESMESPGESTEGEESPEDGGEVKVYNPEDYGTIEEKELEFYGDSGEKLYYYQMENFYLHNTFPEEINATLEQIYDEYEVQYVETAELIRSGFDEFGEPVSIIPYDLWHFVDLYYAGDDYVSILYNDIPYMSGVHPYSRFDGITIDCKTGREVSASELMGKSDRRILEEVSEKMGLDHVAAWDDIDFYLTDSTIVFFYRVPEWWDDVVFERE